MKAICSLHNHTTHSDGYFTPEGLVKVLKENGFNVIAITDHNVIAEEMEYEDVLVIPGIEVSFPMVHIIMLDPRENSDYHDDIPEGEVSWLAHPASMHISPKKALHIIEDFGLDGVEKYNRDILEFDAEVSVDMNYYAVDDTHLPSHIKLSWIEMDVSSLNKEEILENLRTGNFEIFYLEENCN